MSDRFKAYRCRDGGVLIAPECLQPSFHERHAHGPLIPIGTVRCEDFPEDVCGEIQRQVENQLYALVTLEQWRRGTRATS